MEFERAETPSPVSVDKSPNERLSRETWGSRKFSHRLTNPEPIPYEELPQQIELSTPWYELFNKMVADTSNHGNEVHCKIGCIDQVRPLQSRAFLRDGYLLPVNLGSEDSPLIPTRIGIGTKNTAYTKELGAVPFPAAIKWHEKTVPMVDIGLLHTHPTSYPFSGADFFSLGFTENRKFLAALSTHSNRFLIRTDKSPAELELIHATADEIIGDILQKRSIKQRLQTFGQKYFSNQCKAYVEENKHIAKVLNFGLYAGEPNGPLIRLA